MTMPIAYDEGRPLQLTLGALAYLLRYPDAATRARYPEVSQLLHDECMIGEARLAQIDALIRALSLGHELDAQANYMELFDRGRGTALHLLEHVHDDSGKGGPALRDLIATYEAAGLRLRPGELPDHLTVLLEYASTQPPHRAVAVVSEVAPILQRIYGALALRGSGYAALLAALIELAGAPVRAQPAPTEPDRAQWRHRPCFVDAGQRVCAGTP
jgi:nitrate reductase delta subunit